MGNCLVGVAHSGSAAAIPPEPKYPLGCNDRRGSDHSEKDTGMYHRFILPLAVLMAVAATPLLSACHTTAGAGQDISATGKAIESTAKKATP